MSHLPVLLGAFFLQGFDGTSAAAADVLAADAVTADANDVGLSGRAGGFAS